MYKLILTVVAIIALASAYKANMPKTSFIKKSLPLWVRKNTTAFKTAVPMIWEKQKPKMQAYKKAQFFKKLRRNSKFKVVPKSNTKKVFSAMPLFDSVPGNAETTPIFVYNSSRGQRILNSMFSKRKYPMQEPVPGQVLYPPTVPLFKPIPIVNEFGKINSKTKLHNLTMIPFYAHEAVALESLPYNLRPNLSTVPTVAPEALYIEPIEMNKRQVWRRAKNDKTYAAYHTPYEVNWRPMSTALKHKSTVYPYVLDAALHNHRLQSDFDTSTSVLDKDLSENDDDVVDDDDDAEDNSLNIVYVEDSLEKPTTAPITRTLLSSRYSVAKGEIYAFPVFSLGKLLSTTENRHEPRSMSETELETDTNDTADTWFIINSRYKGQYRDIDNKY